MRTGFVFALLLFVATAFAEKSAPLLNQPAPEWSVTNWINSAPLHLKDLKGKVVLVRWWTAPDCPYCRATAPALNDFSQAYTARGLQVIGLYHHKGTDPLKLDDVKAAAKDFGFIFPIAIDPEWKTLHEWWLDRGAHNFTSVSFLIDRHGVVRHIHPGGQYVKGDRAYDEMKKNIERLLQEK